jgi:hypothetical protein
MGDGDDCLRRAYDTQHVGDEGAGRREGRQPAEQSIDVVEWLTTRLVTRQVTRSGSIGRRRLVAVLTGRRPSVQGLTVHQ